MYFGLYFLIEVHLHIHKDAKLGQVAFQSYFFSIRPELLDGLLQARYHLIFSTFHNTVHVVYYTNKAKLRHSPAR